MIIAPKNALGLKREMACSCFVVRFVETNTSRIYYWIGEVTRSIATETTDNASITCI